MSVKNLVHDAVVDARDLLRETVGEMREGRLSDQAVLARYEQHRGNPQAIAQFTAQHLGPDATPSEILSEAARYEAAMESLMKQQKGGR